MTEREALLAGLELSPTILRGFCDSVPSAAWNRLRREGFWTMKEHLAHLVATREIGIERAKLFTETERPRIEPFIPDDDEGSRVPVELPVNELVSVFSKGRQEFLRLIRGFNEVVWAREADHPEYEIYNPLILVRHMYMHDQWHMYRMEELWLTRDGYLTELQ